MISVACIAAPSCAVDAFWFALLRVGTMAFPRFSQFALAIMSAHMFRLVAVGGCSFFCCRASKHHAIRITPLAPLSPPTRVLPTLPPTGPPKARERIALVIECACEVKVAHMLPVAHMLQLTALCSSACMRRVLAEMTGGSPRKPYL